MNARYHEVPRGLFDALATGGGGPEAISALAAAQHSKHVILLRGVFAAAQDADTEQARCARLGWEVLAEIERHGQLSSSSPETFGAVAMSIPPDPETCAVTLTHEVQHLKLCALLDVVPLTLPDDGRRYYAPWRTDPLPIVGLLQGSYAFLGVTKFWRTQRQLSTGDDQLRADGEFALWRGGTARVIDTLLSSGQLTAAGTDFVQRMSEAVSAWETEPVSAEARSIALRESRRRLARWELDNGPVPA